MVAKIIISKNIQKALNYNERKVKDGRAACICAENFLKEKEVMNFHDKLSRFKNLIWLNDRAATNSLHISLNFDPSENLGKLELVQIAKEYMSGIGFKDQPYLVYEHNDAGHPHIHIITTNIQSGGRRINTHNIGRNQSELARKAIEEKFNLVRAAGKQYAETSAIKPVVLEKIKYGKSELKRSVTNVLDAVISRYKYTSLAELNAVLKQYNVIADRGGEQGVIYRSGGLVYRVLDQHGNKVGVPIKASSIYCKPTLATLEKKFIENKAKKKPYKDAVKERVGEVISKHDSLYELIRELRKNRISTVIRKNEQNFIYGITFVDHQTKCVFNGSDLGKEYSAAAIQKTMKVPGPKHQPHGVASPVLPPVGSSHEKRDWLEETTKPEFGNISVPYELRKKKRKKRKKRRDL